MGREVVYCHECGKSLREEEFEKGRAHRVDQIPFCNACRAPDATPPTGVQRALKRAKPGTDRVPGANRRPRPAPGKGLTMPAILGLVAGVALFLILIAIAFSRGGGR